ncbi:MAG: flagellar biosynthetic protein FliQ [Planctomycetota bacterium]
MNGIDLQIVDLARDLLITAVMLAGPVLMVGLVVGLTVSLLQALTSVQEQTMSLVPKMLAVMLLALMFLAPALRVLSEYTIRVLGRMVEFGRS